MTRRTSRTILLLLSAALSVSVAAQAAPRQASSRLRNLAGRMETMVPADAEPVVLDSIAAVALRRGYALVTADREHVRLRLEKPATLAEAAVLGGTHEGNEVKRIDVEVLSGKAAAGTLRVVAAMTIVRNPGATSQGELDVGRRQPFRNQLKALLADVKRAFRP